MDFRDQVLRLLRGNSITGTPETPLLSCEFYLKIIGSKLSNKEMLISSFSIPDLGIGFRVDGENLFIPIPEVRSSIMTVSTYVLRSSNGTDLFKCYFDQFSEGMLALRPVTELPRVVISKRYEKPVGTRAIIVDEPILEFTSCKFSYPVITPDPKSAELAIATCQISFFTFSQNKFY